MGVPGIAMVGWMGADTEKECALGRTMNEARRNAVRNDQRFWIIQKIDSQTMRKGKSTIGNLLEANNIIAARFRHRA